MSHRYTSINIVSKQHLDDLNHVNNVQYLYWAQEVAKAHWNLIQELLDQTVGVWDGQKSRGKLQARRIPWGKHPYGDLCQRGSRPIVHSCG